jgi:nucleoporin NUP82
MPKVKSYAAPFLSGNASGHRLFEPTTEVSRSRSFDAASKKKFVPGPRRTIARRGTEVFVAVGREIRWGDLAYLKDEWANRRNNGRSGSRIKREDSFQSEADSVLESIAGVRVSWQRACLKLYGRETDMM